MTNFTHEPRLNRNYLIGGILVLVAFAALIIGDYYNLTRSASDPSEIIRRWRTVEFGYCNAADLRPCIVAFIRAENGMLVNILLPTSAYPEFYLLVRKGEQTLTYECQKDEDDPRHAQCAGTELLPGETMQFSLVSLEGNIILAEGRFAIIGLMLFTPEAEATASPPVTVSPTATQAPSSTPRSTRTPTAPSYPNPSYPNPAYPNP